MLNRLITGIVGLFALVCVAGVVGASPLSKPAQTGVEGHSLILKVHRCHRRVRRGAGGWHRHVGPYCDRVFVDRGEPPPRRRCRRIKKCKYVGPIKTCKRRTVCDDYYDDGYEEPPPRRSRCYPVRKCKYIGPIKTCKTKTQCDW